MRFFDFGWLEMPTWARCRCLKGKLIHMIISNSHYEHNPLIHIIERLLIVSSVANHIALEMPRIKCETEY